MPKVSVITPIYCDVSQKVDWLDEMIQSVQSQTLTDWEIILINDKSPLPLDPIRMKYANDNRLRWFENAENNGPAKTRNTAVGLAEAECILPLDADDMLANNEASEDMYDAWIMDTTKTVYGNVQLLSLISSGFQRGKVIQLAEYSFENAMNLGGTMPVTVMHSKEAHYQAGGWKAELTDGREDVEYWIATGERGFCGLKINVSTLLYRKHEQSRDYKLKFEFQTLRAMQDKIKVMHSDVYNGRFPVACCGKSSQQSIPDPVVMSQQSQSKKIKYITTLAERGYEFEEKNMEWVAYVGDKIASAGSILVGKSSAGLPDKYPNMGQGHVFQVHKSQRWLFEQRQKLGYEMNQPDPREQKSEPEPIVTPQIAPQITEMPIPEMSTIVRMDNIASQTRKADVQVIQEPAINIQEIVERNTEPIIKAIDEMFEPITQAIGMQSPAIIIDENDPRTIEQDFIDKKLQSDYSLSDLSLSVGLIDKLENAGFNVSELIEMTPQELSELPGIGIKRANSIIAKVQELINKQ